MTVLVFLEYMEIMMENSVDVAGFQFTIVSDCDSITFDSGSGGTSGDAGFTISGGDGGVVLYLKLRCLEY